MSQRRPLLAALLVVAALVVLVVLGAVGASAVAMAAPDAHGGSPALPALETARGQAAIDALGPRLAEIARANGTSTARLGLFLRQDRSLAVDTAGRLLYTETAVAPTPDTGGHGIAGATPAGTAPEAALAPLADTFKLHSRPGAKRIVYLDFDGHTLINTAWNAYTRRFIISAPPFNFEGLGSTFTDNERMRIQQAWQRVAEDYAPFDVDVTTEYLGEAAITRADPSDEYYGMRVLISPMSAYFGNYGGIAYVGAFDDVGDYYKPALVFPERLLNSEKNIGEAATHESGHTLGLYHDGVVGGSAYYQGHSTGDTGWAPIMGTGYYRNLTQWSKGEYPNANNPEDDLAVIASYLGYRADDHGDSAAEATPLAGSGTVTASGLVGYTGDVDVFAVTAGPGTLDIDALPAELGPDLDLLVEVRTAAGTLLASANPVDLLTAGASTVLPAAATYYIHVTGTGKPPLTTGYSDYGSLGAYRLSVTLPAGDLHRPPVAVATVSPTTGTAPLTVTCDGTGSFDPDGDLASWSWDYGDGTTGTGAVTTHSYATPGTYTVTLTVADSGGLTNASTRQVTVVAPNTPPQAHVSASPTIGYAPLQVSLDGSGSSDPDGGIVSYQWQFGDGATGSGVSTTHTYANAGTYTVTLTVTDTGGLTATATAQVTVLASANTPPTARIVASTTSGYAPLLVGFDGRTSSDPDGSIVSYLWRFGDGSSATGATASKYYFLPGTYVVTLTVTDNAGATGTAQVTIRVLSLWGKG